MYSAKTRYYIASLISGLLLGVLVSLDCDFLGISNDKAENQNMKTRSGGKKPLWKRFNTGSGKYLEDSHFENSPLITPRDAARRGIKRFLSIAGSDTNYTAKDCIEVSKTCGHTCGELTGWHTSACWCVRLFNRSLSYYSKKDVYVPDRDLKAHNWKVDTFENFQAERNVLQVAMKEGKLVFPEPVYIIVSTFDYPRLFNPLDHVSQPKITVHHPGEDVPNLAFFDSRAFQAGFPGRRTIYPNFRCGSRNHHFPIMSWSVNPLYNFDLLAPHAHPGDCRAPEVFNTNVTHVPWEKKSSNVLFRGSLGGCDINRKDSQRARFCGFMQKESPEWTKKLNITFEVSDDWMDPFEQASYKFLVLLDGAVAAFRSTWYLSSGSVILSTGVHVDLRTALLKPYVHYIPFKTDYSDFIDQVEMLLYDDKYAKWVGENARAASRLLSLDRNGISDNGFTFDKYYWKILLDEYQSTFRFKEEPGDTDQFTDDRSCETFESPHDCFHNRKYACEGLLQDGWPHYERITYTSSTYDG